MDKLTRFAQVLAATQTPGTGGTEWFQGTADAVRQYSWLFADVKNKDVEDVVILSGVFAPLDVSVPAFLSHAPPGDHLYRMDYMDFVQKHRDSGVRSSSLGGDVHAGVVAHTSCAG